MEKEARGLEAGRGAKERGRPAGNRESVEYGLRAGYTGEKGQSPHRDESRKKPVQAL